ncbi:hypothetical protein OG563_26380 [Nocardia vinacea]|uniref:DUF2746 domain-containing protein n=1 Tax=Nocardia vinacea TaxID=96468 RepID=A0ABZ1YHS6_9NOCA|nr:hypothetical protein [Nocardia vinacea]
MPPEMHPWVVWAMVIAGVVTVAATAVPKVREVLSPIFKFFSGWKVRRIERQVRIEAAGYALNDERNRMLSVQLAGVAAQLDSVLRQNRIDAERHQGELSELRGELAETKAQLAAAMVEVAALRAELAAYRKEGVRG